MGTVTYTVGTSGRNYTSPASAFAAASAASSGNFVTNGNSYVLACYNDSEFTSAGVVLAVSGITTDTTHTLTIKAATGQSWSDNASVQTNAVAYNASNGVGFRSTGFYNSTVTCSILNTFWIGIQVQGTTNQRVFDNNINGGLTDQNMTSCIIEHAPSGGSSAPPLRFRSGLCTNTFVIQRDLGNGVDCDYAGTGLRFVNVTVVRPSDKTANGSGFASSSNTPLIENCAVFGFTNFSSGTFSGSNNCSDVVIGFGTSNQASKTYANQFVSTVDATRDFKAKTGADLLDHAVTDTTNIPSVTDAVGTTRPQGTTWDIGAWELIVVSDVTGTLAYTNNNDTSTAAGTTKILGTLARTNSNDISSGSGTTTIKGILSYVNISDSLNATGNSGTTPSGTLAYTHQNDTLVATGTTKILGTLAKTNISDSLVAAGWSQKITGTVAQTNGNDTSTASGSSGGFMSMLSRFFKPEISTSTFLRDGRGVNTDD